MNLRVFDVLQEEVEITSKSEIVTHPRGHYERGYKVKYDLWTIVKGSVSFTYDNNKYQLNEGDFFLMYPNVLYEAEFLEETTFIYSKFDFSINKHIGILDMFPVAGYLSRSYYNSHELNEIRLALINSIRSHDFMTRYKLNMYFNILITLFISFMLKESNEDPKKYKKLNRILPVLDEMYLNFNKNYPVSYYASVCSMSEKYFITYFKDILGVTPLKYLTHIKMQKAVEYLRERLFTIKEIAYMLGYPDPYNFSSAFKLHFGVAPSYYLVDNAAY